MSGQLFSDPNILGTNGLLGGQSPSSPLASALMRAGGGMGGPQAPNYGGMVGSMLPLARLFAQQGQGQGGNPYANMTPADMAAQVSGNMPLGAPGSPSAPYLAGAQGMGSGQWNWPSWFGGQR